MGSDKVIGTGIAVTDRSSSYRAFELVVPADADLRGVDVTRLNPLEPQNLPPGTRVSLDVGAENLSEREASFGFLYARDAITEGSFHRTVLEVLDDGQVRVSVGDGQTSATSSGLGFGTTDLSVSFGRDSSMEHARLATMTIDTSTAAGRDAYNGFVLLGQVPDTGASFVNDVAQVTTFAYDTAAGFHAEASLLSVDASVDAANRLMHGTETYVSHPDGSWEQDYVQQYSDKASLTYRESSVPGVPNSEGTYTYTFHNLDPVQAGQLSSLYGRPIPAGSTVDVSFSESAMQQYLETRRAVGGSYGPQYKLDGDRGQFASAMLQSQQGDPATVVEWLAHADTDVFEGNRQPIGVGEVKIRT